MSKKRSVSLAVKIVFIVLSVLIIGTVIVGGLSYILNRKAAIDFNADKALALSRAVVAAVDPEQFTQIMQTREKNEYYNTFKAYVDTVLQKNDLMYLYVLDKNHGDTVTYFAEGYAQREDSMLDLGDTEKIEAYDQGVFDAMDQGIESTTDIYDSEGFGYMVSGFAPILDAAGNPIGAVGVDISVDEIVASSYQFLMIILGIVVVLCVMMGIFFTLYIKRSIGRPVAELTHAAESIAQGDIDVTVHARSGDELGKLVESFRHMTDSTREQARILEALADGDLTVNITPRGDKDVMSLAMEKMIGNLSDMFLEINNSTSQVNIGARQIADGAQMLAQGATEQANTVEELSRSIAGVAEQTRSNAQKAVQAAELAGDIKDNAEKGSGQMEQMMHAVKEINDASEAINKVIKVIDDIAFQTNILALNAAVEAARAGQHGKGFAVVAEEVRALAQKSSASAKDTSLLIANSMEKTALGVKIADETFASLSEIVEGIKESSRIVNEIAQSSEEQSEAIEQINVGIDQVAQVVQQNSATSQQSASASQEMSGQAGRLNEMVMRFRLKEQQDTKRLPSLL